VDVRLSVSIDFDQAKPKVEERGLAFYALAIFKVEPKGAMLVIDLEGLFVCYLSVPSEG
jgi:hypothetical protein